MVHSRAFTTGHHEPLWVNCNGCIPGVTKVYLQDVINDPQCYPQYFEYESAIGKDVGVPFPKFSTPDLFYIDSRTLEPNRYYRICVDLDGDASDKLVYEPVDNTYIPGNMFDVTVFYTTIRHSYDPRAVVVNNGGRPYGTQFYTDQPFFRSTNFYMTWYMLDYNYCRYDLNRVETQSGNYPGSQVGIGKAGRTESRLLWHLHNSTLWNNSSAE